MTNELPTRNCYTHVLSINFFPKTQKGAVFLIPAFHCNVRVKEFRHKLESICELSLNYVCADLNCNFWNNRPKVGAQITVRPCQSFN